MKRRTESQIREDDRDKIKRGDRVSWRLPYDGSPRAFGRVVEIKRAKREYPGADIRRTYGVTEDDTNIPRVIPARFITKECG